MPVLMGPKIGEINDQGNASQNPQFSLLSTFYNIIDNDVNFFVTISSGFRGIEVQGFGVRGSGFRVQRFIGSGFRGSRFGVQRFRVQPCRWPRASSQIEKETLKKRISNIE